MSTFSFYVKYQVKFGESVLHTLRIIGDLCGNIN